MNTDDTLARLDREDKRRQETLRVMLIEAGRQDLADDLDRKLRDIRLGLDSARATWNVLSFAQRTVMLHLERGGWLDMPPHSRTRFYAFGPAIGDICGAPTVRNLMWRELVGWEAGRKVVLTERGMFVLKHGRTA